MLDHFLAKKISKINYPAAEQRGIFRNVERPKGRGIEPYYD